MVDIFLVIFSFDPLPSKQMQYQSQAYAQWIQNKAMQGQIFKLRLEIDIIWSICITVALLLKANVEKSYHR